MMSNWLQKYIRFPHRAEWREIIVFCAATAAIGICIIFIVRNPSVGWLYTSQYVIAALQLLAALLFAGLMLLFKTKKLF